MQFPPFMVFRVNLDHFLAGKNEKLFTICGSLPYVAPELLQEKRYEGQPVDIYALGVLLYFMTTGQMPFTAATIAQLKRTIILGVVPTPAHLSNSCATLIRSFRTFALMTFELHVKSSFLFFMFSFPLFLQAVY